VHFRHHIFQGTVVEDAQELTVEISLKSRQLVYGQTVVADEALELVKVLILPEDLHPRLYLALLIGYVKDIRFIFLRFSSVPESNYTGFSVIQPGFRIAGSGRAADDQIKLCNTEEVDINTIVI